MDAVGRYEIDIEILGHGLSDYYGKVTTRPVEIVPVDCLPSEVPQPSEYV